MTAIIYGVIASAIVFIFFVHASNQEPTDHGKATLVQIGIIAAVVVGVAVTALAAIIGYFV